ncbi:hypothetical protein E1B25_21400 [Antarcticimicrobium sediminis]|uniref:Uncharacterized protein n=1 Tax=Antarcticimicrobium sediminis TaxID=2546227 RepID=A0A4R5EG00_9RHOB|nr:hypothetical protein E1B25_21400 [Antarcticimicrobium sediminis]
MLVHGHAHGAELGQAGAAGFGAGFVLATAALHAAGIAMGLKAANMGQRPGTRSMQLVCILGASWPQRASAWQSPEDALDRQGRLGLTYVDERFGQTASGADT